MATIISTGVILVFCAVLWVVSKHRHNQQRIDLIKERDENYPELDPALEEAYAKVAEAEKELRIRGMVVDHFKIEEALARRQLAEFDAKEAARK